MQLRIKLRQAKAVKDVLLSVIYSNKENAQHSFVKGLRNAYANDYGRRKVKMFKKKAIN